MRSLKHRPGESQLSFKPLKVALAPSSGEKIDIIAEKVLIFGQNFQLQSALISDFATRLEVSPI